MTGTTASARTRPRATERPYLSGAHARGRNIELRRQLDAIALGSRDYKQVIRLIIRLHNAQHASKHKGVSFKTMHERENFYFAFFHDLRRETHHRSIEPRKLAPRHVESMAEVWEARGLGVGTIANYLSYLRTWCQWTERPAETVRDAAHYYGEDSPLAHRRQAAEYDHSWVAAGIDHAEILPRIAALCPFVAIQTEFSRLFAARPKEARCLCPHEAVIPISQAIADDIPPGVEATHCLRFEHGTKGGRVRDVPIVTPAQWDLVDRAKAMVAPGQHLGRPGHSLQANTAHYYRVLAKVGVTRKLVGTSGHGLRHEQAGDCYHAVAGVPPPVRGGTAPDRATDLEARTAVAKLLGHNRPAIASCYLGSPSVRPATKADEQADARPDEGSPQ